MIAEVALALPIKGNFDYLSTYTLQKGMRVLVDFRHKKEVGVVVGFKHKSSYTQKLKEIIEPLDNIPSLPLPLLKFCYSLSRNYVCSYGEALRMSLPVLLRRKRKININPVITDKISYGNRRERIYIREDFYSKKRFLLYGAYIEKIVKAGRQVIICLPRWQDVAKFVSFLPDKLSSQIAYLSSFQAPYQQLDNWLKIRSGNASICIGTRMAIFAPFSNLGLIIVEKESFPGYFQPQKPFYNLKDIAWLLSKLTESGIVFSSDFVSLESFALIKKKKMELLDLKEKKDVAVKIFNLRDIRRRRYPVFSYLALSIIEKYLRQNKRVAVFWRRKGFSYFVRCQNCGYIAECPNCNIPFVYWKRESVLRCSRCGHRIDFSSTCPVCRGKMLKQVGVGEERAESILSKYFPAYKVVSLRNTSLAENWHVAVGGQKEILSLPEKPALVVVSGIDSLFSHDNLNAAEEGFLLLLRLREMAEEEMVVFTFLPDYYPFIALKRGEEWFYKKELSQRRQMKLPPYFHLAEINIRSKIEKIAEKKYRELLLLLGKVQKNAPFYLYDLGYTKKLRGNFYYTFILKAKNRSVIKDTWDRVGNNFRSGKSRISFYLN